MGKGRTERNAPGAESAEIEAVQSKAVRAQGAQADAGLRLIAAFEALKGALVLMVAFALFRYINADLETFCEDLVRHLHLNSSGAIARRFLLAAGKVPDSQMGLLILAAVLYAVIRFIEAFGLWHNRAWAEWFALISCAIYVPVEIYELSHGFSGLKIGLLAVNIVVVVYLALELV